MKQFKRVFAGILCALLLVQGTPQMAIAMQIPNVDQIAVQQTEYEDTDTETVDDSSMEDGTDTDESNGETNSDATSNMEAPENNTDNSEITEVSDTEHVEPNEQIENTEITEVSDTEHVESTEIVENAASSGKQENVTDDAEIMILDAGEGDNDTDNKIKINVQLEGADEADFLIVKCNDVEEKAISTNPTEFVIDKTNNLVLNITNLNGLKIKSVKWGATGEEAAFTTNPDQNQIEISSDKLVNGYNLIIEVEYYHFNICLNGVSETDTLSGIELDGVVNELENDSKEQNSKKTRKSHTIKLSEKNVLDVAVLGNSLGANIEIPDLMGLEIEDVKVDGTQIKDSDLVKVSGEAYIIQVSETLMKKMQDGNVKIVITVRVLDTFEIGYENGEFVDTGKKLINPKFGVIDFIKDENGKKTCFTVTGNNAYYAKQLLLDENDIEAKRNVVYGSKDQPVGSVTFSAPETEKAFDKIKLQMTQQGSKPTMIIEENTITEDGNLVIYRKDWEKFDLFIQAKETGSGVDKIAYKKENQLGKNAVLVDVDSNIWKIEQIDPRDVKNMTITAYEFCNNAPTTIQVKILVDSDPPKISTSTVKPDGISVVSGKDTTYWLQTGDKPALTFMASEENGPITAEYTFYKIEADKEEKYSQSVTCELEDIQTGTLKSSLVQTTENSIKLVSAADFANLTSSTSVYEQRRLTFDFGAMFKETAYAGQINSLTDFPDGNYIIKAKFNDATKRNSTGEIELATFEINKKKPVIAITEGETGVQWSKGASESVKIKATLGTKNTVTDIKYAVTYVTGEDANNTLGEDAKPDAAVEWKSLSEEEILNGSDDIKKTAEVTYELPLNQISAEGTVKFYLWAQDGLGNITHSAPIVYNIDKTSPTYQNFSVEADLNPAQRIFRYIFGTFTNKEETLTLKIDALDPYGEGAYYATGEGDEQPAVSKATLYYVDDDTVETTATTAGEIYEWLKENKAAEAVEATSHEGNTYSFNLKVDENNKFYRLYFAFEDKAGNITIANVAALDDGSGTYKLTKYMVDDTAPVIESKIQDASANADYQEKDGDKTLNWYAGAHEVAYDIKVTDEQSGIFNVTVTANGTELTTDANGTAFYDANQFYQQNQPDMMTLEKGFSYVVKTGAGDIGKDGRYKIAIKVSDNAGNTSNTTETIYIDQDEPVITHMEFDTGAKDELSTVPLQYGYFFQNETKVTVYATDYIGNSKQMGSGVQKLIYQLKPAEGQTPAAQELTPKMDDNGVYSVKFTIPAGFKGQIEVKAVDNVGQDSGYYNPKGAVVETEEEHNNTSEAKIVLPETDRKDSEGNPLYANDIQIGLITKDSRSGLKENDWSVSSYSGATIAEGLLAITSTYNEKNKTWQSVTEGDTNWNISDNLDLNLVTNAQKSLEIVNDENHVTVELGITDNAGNASMAEKKIFSIDKTAPVIEVKYDNNQALKEQYYKEKRVAIITVKDANFSKNACTFNIQGPEVTISEWTHQGGDGCDGTVHTHACTYTCQVEFAQDGDYIFGFSCEDLAGNEATYEKEDKFTIDTEKPVISVHYDNNNAVDGNYYKAARTATIEIEDKNFDQTATEVDVTAALDNGETGTPQVSSFTQSGDVWSATVRFVQDGDYSIKVSSTDLAGNVADDYDLEEFTVDQTEPELTIGGVEDHSANKDKVLPVIYCEDNNIDAASFYISLTGANNGETQYKSTRVTKENSIQVSIADFAHKAEVDDLYTLEAGVTDLAGNETVETIVFSVNRFGSVYILDDSTQALVDNFYTNEEQDIVVTEVNVDSLQFKEIDYSYDGSIITLQEGKDYKVTSRTDMAGWKMYEYRIDKKNFASEGSYVISIYSEDMAQNKSSNKAKGKELAFVVDKTAPSIVVGGVENNGQYVEANRNVNVDTQDNILLESVEVYVGNEMKASAGRDELLESDGQLALALPGNNETQRLYVVAKDAAGNTTRSDDIEFLITSNLFVQWYSNVPLCVGSTAVTVGAGGLFMFRKRIPFEKLFKRVK